ncbi:DUF6817 domain-containing protein [Microbispora sp. NPDC049125]|uniref:DUF6817 domain-containing protein n=1 Tax=Microbispora sp. NPDC049125 TaxID=3154929 RepID=UPI003465493D
MHAHAIRLLRQLGAETVPHPGGTLLDHLIRVRDRLVRWNAVPALQAAGLCHAFYGTDGFPTALVGLGDRDRLVEVSGHEAEKLVYWYGACDRTHVYPQLGAADPIEFRDRFTGRTAPVAAAELAWFAELTAANELDLADHDADFAAAYGPDLLNLFTRARPLLSTAAWTDCQTILMGRSEPMRID